MMGHALKLFITGCWFHESVLSFMYWIIVSVVVPYADLSSSGTGYVRH